MDLQAKHIVVSGGSKRIGLELTRFFLKEKGFVTCLFRSRSSEIKQLESDYPEHLRCLSYDLTDFGSLDRAGKSLSEAGRSVDALINVASDFFRTPLGTISQDQWDRLFDTNIKGHFFLIQALLPLLAKPSVIINLVDIFAEKPLRGYSPYAAAKGALLTLTRNLAAELAPHTRVNAVSPGAVLLPDSFTEEEKSKHTQNNLLGRLGHPNDIVEAISFLVKNDYITGFNLKVDGGSSLL